MEFGKVGMVVGGVALAGAIGLVALGAPVQMETSVPVGMFQVQMPALLAVEAETGFEIEELSLPVVAVEAAKMDAKLFAEPVPAMDAEMLTGSTAAAQSQAASQYQASSHGACGGGY